MPTKLLARGVLLFALVTLNICTTSHAQRLVDGYRISVGLAMYGGDLDGNPNSDLPSYVGAGRLLVQAGADHEFGNLRLALELGFAQLKGTNVLVDGTHTVLSSDVVLSYNVYGPIAVYAGVGPSVVLPKYDRMTPNAVLDGWATEGAHFEMTFPIGVILQETVRIGLRLTNSDTVDGYVGGSSKDIMGQFSIGYRFGSH